VAGKVACTGLEWRVQQSRDQRKGTAPAQRGHPSGQEAQGRRHLGLRRDPGTKGRAQLLRRGVTPLRRRHRGGVTWACAETQGPKEGHSFCAEGSPPPLRTVLRCTVLHSASLYCTVLWCHALYCKSEKSWRVDSGQPRDKKRAPPKRGVTPSPAHSILSLFKVWADVSLRLAQTQVSTYMRFSVLYCTYSTLLH